MNMKEKRMLIEEYQVCFSGYLSFPTHENESMWYAQKRIMKLFFTTKEILCFENELRINSNYYSEFFESIESWMDMANNQYHIEQEVPFTWDEHGLKLVEQSYDWLFKDEEYKGFLNALVLAFNKLDEYNQKYSMYK